MNELKIFNNEEFGEIRTATVNNEPMFCLTDVCRALELKNPAMVKTRLNEKGINSIDTLTKGGNQKILYINESNLYKTIFQSRKESAERFTDWVTSEILPSIRKHGIYATDNMIDNILNNPDFGIELLTKLKEERAAKEIAEKKAAGLEKENGLLAQKTLEWADRPLINALVRAYGHSLEGDYRKAWTDFKKELLYRYGINLNARKTAHLNAGGSKSRKMLDFINDDELQQAISTAVALCRNNEVDISEIIEKKAG